MPGSSETLLGSFAPSPASKVWVTVRSGGKPGLEERQAAPLCPGLWSVSWSWAPGPLCWGVCLRLQVHQQLREELAKVKTLEGIAAVSQELKLRCQARAAGWGWGRGRWEPPCPACQGGAQLVTEGPRGFCRRTCAGRRRGRNPQVACLSSTGSANPISGQGECHRHGVGGSQAGTALSAPSPQVLSASPLFMDAEVLNLFLLFL